MARRKQPSPEQSVESMARENPGAFAVTLESHSKTHDRVHGAVVLDGALFHVVENLEQGAKQAALAEGWQLVAARLSRLVEAVEVVHEFGGKVVSGE